jgi:hypothetical protein
VSSRSAPATPPLPGPSPADIRRLRGGMSRPRFAALLGVSANTVYRWELPPESPHHLSPSPGARQALERPALERPEEGRREGPQGADVVVTAVERLCAPMHGESEGVLGVLCGVLRELVPGAAVGVFAPDGTCVAGDASLVHCGPHETARFGDRLGRHYLLRLVGPAPADLVRPLLAVVELALEAARLREGSAGPPTS